MARFRRQPALPRPYPPHLAAQSTRPVEHPDPFREPNESTPLPQRESPRHSVERTPDELFGQLGGIQDAESLYPPTHKRGKTRSKRTVSEIPPSDAPSTRLSNSTVTCLLRAYEKRSQVTE